MAAIATPTQPPRAAAAPDRPPNRVTGTGWFSHKGLGFIDRHDGGDVDVHYSGINGTGFRAPSNGARVAFDVVATPRGPEAVDVVVLETRRQSSMHRCAT